MKPYKITQTIEHIVPANSKDEAVQIYNANLFIQIDSPMKATDAKIETVEELSGRYVFNYMSPDGIHIDGEWYKTPEQAKKAFDEWCKRFEAQGYYSSNEGRISLEELPNDCTLDMMFLSEDDFKAVFI